MPRVDDRGRRVPTVKKPTRKPKRVPTPDQQDRNRAPRRAAPRPAPKPTPRGVSGAFGGARSQRPFTVQRAEAQRRVDVARRRLPRAPVAQPPSIRNPTRRQVQAARSQVTRSVRAVTGGLRGAERQAETARLTREIATDPRYSGTDRALRRIKQAEAVTGRPQTLTRATARVPTILQSPVAASILPEVNVTALTGAVQSAVENLTPGLQAGTAEAQFARNALKDVGLLATGPFIGGYTAARANAEDMLAIGRGENVVDTVTGGETAGIVRGIAAGIKEEVTNPGEAFRKHPLLTALDAAGVVAVAGRGAGAAARGAGSTVDAPGARGALARIGSTRRSSIALTDDPALGGVIERTGSKDLTRKAVQSIMDSFREPVRRPDGSVVTDDRGLPILQPRSERERGRLANRRADFLASRANLLERAERGNVESTVRTPIGAALRGGREPVVNRGDDATWERMQTVALERDPKWLADNTEPGTQPGVVKARGPKGGAEYWQMGPEGKPIGYLYVSGKGRREERMVYVDPQYRRKGVASRLYEEAKADGMNVTSRGERTAAGKAFTGAIGTRRTLRRGGGVPGVKGRAARDVVAMVAEGTVLSAKTFGDDLKARLGVVRSHLAEHDAAVKAGRGNDSPYRTLKEARAARKEAETIEKVLNSPKALAQAPRIVAAGEALARRQVEADTANVAAGLFTGGEAQARRRRLAVTALAHQGAKYFTEEEHARAERAARDAGDDALADAVSGRDPVRVQAHRAAQGKVDDLQVRAKRAQAEQARYERRVQRLVGANASRRGREPGATSKVVDGERVATTAAEARRIGEISDARRAARSAKARRQAAEKALRKARQTLRETPMPERNAGIRTGEGRYLSNDEIEQFLRDRGRDPETVAALPHRGDVVGQRAYHSKFGPGGRPTMDKGETFTGAAYQRGAQGTTAQLLADQGVRQRVQLVKAQQVDRLVGDHGMRHPAWAKARTGAQLTAHEQRVVDKGGYFTGKEAAELIDRAEDSGQRLVAMTALPAKLDEGTQQIIRENYQGPAGMEALGQRLLKSRMLEHGELGASRARNVVLVNADLVDRLNKQLTPAGGLRKFGQVLNAAFRYAVLPQPRWLTGEFVEAYVVRLTAAGSGLNVFGLAMDIRAANKTLRVMDNSPDPKVRAAAKEVRAQQVSRGLFVGGRGAGVRRRLEDFPALHADVEKAYGKMVQRLPVTRQMAEMTGMLLANGGKALLAPLDAVFAIGRASGAGAQRAAFGRSIRKDIQEFTGSWAETVRLGEKAVAEAAKGLAGTPTQERFARSMYETLGKYDGFGPTMRGLIQGPAPFIPWALNAARFTMWTMPAHHTILTSLLLKVNEVVAKDWEEIHKPIAGLKGGLQLAVPNGKGGWVDIARYTPWGLSGPIAEGDPRAIAGQFFPQISGARAALEGDDPFGRPAVTSAGERGQDIPGAKRLGIGAYNFAEAMTPYGSMARRLQERGETAFADSTVWAPRSKPGTSHGMSAARRVLDPFRPTYVGAAGGQVVSGPAPGSTTNTNPIPGGIPASVDRALERIDAAERAMDRIDAAGDLEIPPSVERALSRIP